MDDASAKVMDLIFGRWRSQILYAGVKLGVFDALADGPRAAADIAGALGLDPALSYRLLRALASLELIAEDQSRTFSLTPMGALLRSDHPQTMRGMTLLEEGPEHYALWKHLPAMVRDGKQNAFIREFGHMAFDHAAQHAAYGAVFNEAMSSYSSADNTWVLEALEHYDFSSISHLCDVGGGHGHTLCSLLVKYPHLRGTVLERPDVIANTALLWADRMGVGERCAYIPGDMFRDVPPADGYMMKRIIHDWNDEECMQILATIHRAAGQHGRVFIMEAVVPEPGTPHFSKLFDIHMMCWGTGRERTTEEYAGLLEGAGWKYLQTWYPSSRMLGVVEGVKA